MFGFTALVRSRLYTIDPAPVVAEGLKCMFANDDRICFVGHAKDANTAFVEIPKLKPDLVVLEIALPDRSGLKVIRHLRETVKVLVFSAHDESLYGERCMRAGTMGYLTKAESEATVIEAVHKVRSGGFYFSANLVSYIISNNREPRRETNGCKGLSDRQLEVFELVGRGFNSREIARKLRLGTKTVESHKSNIKEKLCLGSSRELLIEALKWIEKRDW